MAVVVLLGSIMISNPEMSTLVAEFGRKYMWWQPVGDAAFTQDRIIAQAMDLGTYEDILLLEKVLGAPRLLEVMVGAQPGWLSARSREFWRGRLSHATGAALPDRAPRRSFDAAV